MLTCLQVGFAVVSMIFVLNCIVRRRITSACFCRCSTELVRASLLGRLPTYISAISLDLERCVSRQSYFQSASNIREGHGFRLFVELHSTSSKLTKENRVPLPDCNLRHASTCATFSRHGHLIRHCRLWHSFAGKQLVPYPRPHCADSPSERWCKWIRWKFEKKHGY